MTRLIDPHQFVKLSDQSTESIEMAIASKCTIIHVARSAILGKSTVDIFLLPLKE